MKGYREQVGVEQFYNELLDSYKTEGVTAVQTENDLIAANLLNLCLERGSASRMISRSSALIIIRSRSM